MRRWCPHKPTPRQAELLASEIPEVLYGGSVGGGKSDALLMAALQYADKPHYAAILFRRTYADLALPGALIDRAHQWLSGTAAKWNGGEKTWTFPGGATLSFGYLDHPDHKYRYQSSEFQFIGFDELTQFGESEYTYLFSRLRRLANSDIPLRMWSASNPGGRGHEWVRRRFLVDGAAAGRAFIRAKLDDNPHIDQASYLQSLKELDPLTREHLLEGNWDANDDGLLRYDDIYACQTDCLWPRGEPVRGTKPELYLGVDIGRTKDLTVIWTWEKIGDVCWCRDMKILQNVSFAEQKIEIKKRLTGHVVKCAIDRGGIGYQLAEELHREYPAVVEEVQLTAGVQGLLAQRLAVGFAERKVRIPDDPDLRDDLRLVRRTRVVGGVDKVETKHGEVGHADRFWAAALGYDAAQVHRPTVTRRPIYEMG